MRSSQSILALLALVALATSGCSATGRSVSDTDEPIDEAAARQQFQTSCRACHSLSDADAHGVFGPDLDALQPDVDRVRQQIDDGGGGMPADILTGDDADLVARYVAEVAGRGPDPEDEATRRGGSRARDEADS